MNIFRKNTRYVLLMCYRNFVIYRGNESMEICKTLAMYYFFAFQCKPNVCLRYKTSQNLHQNVRSLKVMSLYTLSLYKQRITAGLLRVMRCQTVLRHTAATYKSALKFLNRKFERSSRLNTV